MEHSSNKNNNKVAPLRISQLLPELLAMQDDECEDYGSGSDGDYPDRSFSDGDVANSKFYENSHKKIEITHPISSKTMKERHFDVKSNDSCYNQTYPTKESHSANKNKSKMLSTPLRTPVKDVLVSKHSTGSGSSVRATPHSNGKNKTPRYRKGIGLSSCKSSAKKFTPFRKCLDQDEAFKSATKAPLFSTSKAQPTHASQQHNVVSKDVRPAIKPTALDEIFAAALQISDQNSEKGEPTTEKTNPFGNNRNQKINMFATPKTNVTSNSIIKGCRDNNFITPLKPMDISGINKYETPCTQNRSLFRNQQTPLFTIKEKGVPAKQSVRKNETVTGKNKENEIVKNDGQYKKSLFIDTIDEKLDVLKDNNGNKPSSIFKNDSSKKIIADSCFKTNLKSDASKQHPRESKPPHFFHSQPLNRDRCNDPSKVSHQSNVVPIDSIRENHHHFKYTNESADKDNRQQQNSVGNNVNNTRRRVPAVENQPNSTANQAVSFQMNNNCDESDLHSRLPIADPQFQQRQQSSQQSQQPQAMLMESVQPVTTKTTNLSRQYKTLTIKGKQYTVLGSLGSGGSSEVLKVMDPEDLSMCAVKCVNLAVEQSVAQNFVQEIKLLQKLQGSDRVITMYDYEFVERKRMLYVVLEMGGVDLSKLMKGFRAKESKLPLPMLVYYWTEMLTAVRHIHQKGIIHSDLKPANFLVVDGRLKLIDFGIASSLNADATSVLKDSTTGTFSYISPEAVNAGSEGRDLIKISYKSDVWSLGCILYSMLYGRTPFSHVTHIMAKIRVLCNPDQVIEYPDLQGVPQVFMQALRWCLTYDIKKRPSVQQLIELPYMGEISRPLSNVKKVPFQTMLKIKEALTQEELAGVINALEGK